jgi:SRSO17 transposase
VWEKPVSAAIERIDQCVASTGVVRRPLDHGSNLIVVDSSRSAGASLIKQTIAAIVQKSTTPFANCVFVEAELSSHILARQAVCTSQNDTASLRERPGNTVTTNLPPQIRPLLRTQHQRRDRPAS